MSFETFQPSYRLLISNNQLPNILGMLERLEMIEMIEMIETTEKPKSKGISSKTRNSLTRKRLSTNQQCVVCQEEMESSTEVISLKCGHCFHPHCLLPWVQDHDNCPMCRATINIPLTIQEASCIIFRFCKNYLVKRNATIILQKMIRRWIAMKEYHMIRSYVPISFIMPLDIYQYPICTQFTCGQCNQFVSTTQWNFHFRYNRGVYLHRLNKRLNICENCHRF